MVDKALWADLLLAVLLVSAACALVIVVPGFRAEWRTGLALLTLLLVPGYLMTVAFFPRQGDLGAVDRMTLALGFSIMSVAVLGPLLNALPGAVTPGLTAQGVWLWSVAWASVAGLRRRAQAPDALFLPLRQRRHLRTGTLFVAACVGVVVGLGAVMGRLHAGVTFTEFSMLGTQGRLADYPSRVPVGGDLSLTLVIRNLEGRALAYQIRPSRCPQIITTPPVPPGQEWRGVWRCASERLSGTDRLTFTLYRSGDRAAYRFLTLQLR